MQFVSLVSFIKSVFFKFKNWILSKPFVICFIGFCTNMKIGYIHYLKTIDELYVNSIYFKWVPKSKTLINSFLNWYIPIHFLIRILEAISLIKLSFIVYGVLKIILFSLVTIRAWFSLLDGYYFIKNKKKFDVSNSSLNFEASILNSIIGYFTFASGLIFTVIGIIAVSYNIDEICGVTILALAKGMITLTQLEMSQQSSIKYVTLLIKYYQPDLLIAPSDQDFTKIGLDNKIIFRLDEYRKITVSDFFTRHYYYRGHIGTLEQMKDFEITDISLSEIDKPGINSTSSIKDNEKVSCNSNNDFSSDIIDTY